MHQRLERKPTGSASQIQGEEGFNVLKKQITSSPYIEQRSSKRELAREHTRLESPSHLNEAEHQPKTMREPEAIRQELAGHILKIETIDKEYADLHVDEKTQELLWPPDLSYNIIHENQKEAEQKETHFQELCKALEQTRQTLSKTNKQTEELERYQQVLKQEAQTSPHMLKTTSTLGKQIELLDIAITSLQEEPGSKQKSENFSAQKHEYLNKKATYIKDETRLSMIEKQLTKTRDIMKQDENELRKLDQRLQEITGKRDAVQKEHSDPLQVTQKLADQLTMANDHIHYLEQEIATKKTAQPDAHLTSLLITEKKHVNDLLAKKDEYIKSEIERNHPVDDELKETLIEIRTLKQINALFEREQAILKRLDPNDSMEIQSKIEKHLNDNKEFLSSSITYQHKLEKLSEEDQSTPESPNAQKHEITEIEPSTTRHPIELQNIITNKKIFLMDEQLATIEQILKEKKSNKQDTRASGRDASKKYRKSAEAGGDYPQKLYDLCTAQRNMGEAYYDKLEQISQIDASKTTVMRPLSEQLTMVQNLKHLYKQDSLHPERLRKLLSYQQTLETLSMRQLKTPERLDKQIEMTKELISFLENDFKATTDTLKHLTATSSRHRQENKRINELQLQKDRLSSQIVAEQLYLKELDTSQLKESLSAKLDAIDPSKRHGDMINELANLTSSKRRSQQLSIRDAQQRLQELEYIDSSKIHEQTFVTRDAQKQLTLLDDLIKYLEAKRKPLQSKLDQAQQSKDNLEQSMQEISSDLAQVHPTRATQLELVEHNLQHLRQKSQQYNKDIQEKDIQKEVLRARLIHLCNCDDILAKNSLSSIDPPRFDTHTWKEHKRSLQAEIQQLRQASSVQDNTMLEALQERLHQTELFDKLLLQENDKTRNISPMLSIRAWDYVEQLDLQRDHLQQLQKEIEVINNENYKKLRNHKNSARTYYFIHEKNKFQEFDEKRKMLRKQFYASGEVMQQVDEQLEDVTTKIRRIHRLLKVLAERKNEDMHPFFLSEHMIHQDDLRKFGISPLTPVRVFKGTDDSMCLPSSVRMICHDHDPNFASKAKEVTAALNPEGSGGARLANVPQALENLGHPIPYKTAIVDSIHHLIDQIKFDKLGNCPPFIIMIERKDRPGYSTHALVCHRIFESNKHHYAVLRDPLRDKPFGMRLEHLNEVLASARINVVIPV